MTDASSDESPNALDRHRHRVAVAALRRPRSAIRLAYAVATRPGVRRSVLLRLRRPANLFQPHNDTAEDRYPEVFGLLGRTFGGRSECRVLSFGCSTGEEVFTLRRYLPEATILGLDISRGNIADCRRRLAAHPDSRLSFAVAGSTAHLADGSLDAITCMAVLRHAELSNSPARSCAPLITFDAFSRTVTDLARCLGPGGLLAIEHSNFRFGDVPVARSFDCALRIARPFDPTVPHFGPDDVRLPDVGYGDVVFRKIGL